MSRSADGWMATALGGTIGAIVCGTAGMLVAIAYVDSGDYEGLEGLGVLVIGTILAGLVGAALGAAGALKLRGHSRPVASGIVFSIAAGGLFTGIGLAVSATVPGWDEGPLLVVTIALAVIPSALLARAIAGRSESQNREEGEP